MSDYFNLNDGVRKAKSRFPKFNIHFNKKLLFVLAVTLALPITVVLALTQQNFFKLASGPELASVAIHPGSINTQTGSKPQPMSTLAYDSSGNPVFSGITYEWSMSSTNSVGTLTKTQGDLSEFLPLSAGCGQLTVIARSGNQTITKSVSVAVSDSNQVPDCSPVSPTPTSTSNTLPPFSIPSLQITIENFSQVINIHPGERVNWFNIKTDGAEDFVLYGYPTSYGVGINKVPSTGGLSTNSSSNLIEIQVNSNVPPGTYKGVQRIKTEKSTDYYLLPEVTVNVIAPTPIPTETPTPTPGSVTFGKALKLNGVDSCAEITSPTSKLDYASAQSSLQSTIEGWFRVDDQTRIYSGFDTHIVSREAGKDFFPSMSVFIRSGKLNFAVITSDDGSGNLTTGNAYSAQVIGTTPVQLNKWYHFAGVRDNGVISLYLNGKKDGISSKFVYSNNLLAKDGSLGIGCYKDSRTGQSYYGGFIKGQIDEIRASNKVRYTQDFIAPQPVPFIADEYTLALWHMDGSLVDSLKGSENNAIPIGKVEFIDSSIGEPITPNPSPTATPVISKLTLNPSADSYVRADQPTTNFGTVTYLQTDQSPNTLSFLKFNLTSLNGKKIVNAKLILKLNQASGVLQSLRREDDKAWSEKGITFNNKPSNTSLIKTFNAKPVGSTIELDVKGAVNLKKGGNLTLGITSAGNDIARFYSREAAAGNRPQLIIEYQ